jgi:hypothetical protein
MINNVRESGTTDNDGTVHSGQSTADIAAAIVANANANASANASAKRTTRTADSRRTQRASGKNRQRDAGSIAAPETTLSALRNFRHAGFSVEVISGEGFPF